MRLLVISDLFPPVSYGGYEMECAAVVEHLRRSHEVTVLTSRRHRRRMPRDSRVLRELPYSGAGRLSQLRSPLDAIRAIRITNRVIADTDPELVFVWNATGIPTTAVRAATDRGLPVAHRMCERWFAERGVLADHFMRYLLPGHAGVPRIWAAIVKLANRHRALRVDPYRRYPAAMSYNSDALRLSVGAPASVEPVLERVIHPATGSGPYFARLPRLPAPRPTVLFVGRLWPAKGVDVAVEAVKALEEQHSIVVDLELAGPADRRSRRQLEQHISRLGLRSRVRRLGQLDTQQLGAALQRAHVLVAPSRAEAFGLACVEAAHARVPVVASRVDGIPEALREHEHALFFESGDAAGCAAALAATLGDTDATGRRVRRAFERASELSLENYLADTDDFLAEAASIFAERR